MASDDPEIKHDHIDIKLFIEHDRVPTSHPYLNDQLARLSFPVMTHHTCSKVAEKFSTYPSLLGGSNFQTLPYLEGGLQLGLYRVSVT